MTEQEARQFVTLLAAHYPRVQLQQAHYDAYTRVVQRYAADSAGVLDTITAMHVHWPSVAEVAQAFATAAVGAPLPSVAWEQAQAYCMHRTEMVPCGPCGGTGGDGPSTPCVYCRGMGDVPRDPLPEIHPIVKRAIQSFGGSHAVRNHDRPQILRAQFIKTYGEFLGMATEYAALGGSWQSALTGMAGPPQLAVGT